MTMVEKLRSAAHATADDHAAAALFQAATEIEAMTADRVALSERWQRLCSAIARGSHNKGATQWEA